jgi:putative redox protein
VTPPTNRVVVDWAGEHRFDAGRPNCPRIRVDADAATGPGPVDTMLIALGTCTSVDVVDILAKRRTPVASLQIEVVGERHDGIPRRLVNARLVYRMRGAGIERAHAERAIELAVNKYCSVRESLDPKIPVEWTLELDGEG